MTADAGARTRAAAPPETGGAAEASLLARFLAERDEASFHVLYRLHSPLLYRVILRSLGRDAQAEDVLQETWVRAVRGLPSFRRDSSLRTWLTGIALRCCHEARRAGPEGAEEPAAPVAGVAPTSDSRLDLEHAVGALAPGRREVLLLHDVEGFTHAEIAALLDIDEGTSKSQLSRARRQVRERLEAAAGEPHSTEEPIDARD
ncbi:MAG TPA: RNA polymerase sigma factor [Thermoanaerobaculia bacterium]|nr:RNA polymerase sigma factor [Thermoanaerobaculia bacterium]